MFILGLIVFFSIHLFAALFRTQRAAVIGKVGEKPFKGLYSLGAIIGLALIIIGWPQASTTLLYSPPLFLRHVAFALMSVSIILLIAAHAPAGRIAPAVQHPMLAGVKIWAFAHLLANGEMRSVLLFGSFLGFAVIDRIAVKKRGVAVRPAGPVRNDVIVIVIGVLVYGLIAHFLHRYIAGVALY